MIKHILADGTELESINGLVVPSTGNTEAVYRLIAEFLKTSKSKTLEESLCANET